MTDNKLKESALSVDWMQAIPDNKSQGNAWGNAWRNALEDLMRDTMDNKIRENAMAIALAADLVPRIKVCRAGITTDLERRKKEHFDDYPTMFSWNSKEGAFPSREAAQDWEDEQENCEKSGGGRNPDDPNAKWYGYWFYYFK